MTDHLSPKRRSAAMAKVRSENTSAEKRIYAIVKSLRISFVMSKEDLPGKPDLVFPSRRKVIFVNGCFWHFHHCKRLPKSNRAFWRAKFVSNKTRDRKVTRELIRSGWQVLTVWECWKKRPEYLRKRISIFLRN